ncbi:UPF0481 protein At3g47200-like [Vicia villosa]|uniref:UPF0481 protein At3g47200-like n=1 Tax=Vicia villosa TaxID=3911 RepID=UPI00273C79E3|nr:UPF0481 protein At3g47200-like [Vicia villosa]
MMASEITLDEKFLELQNAKKPTQNSHPKIQKVPQNLRNRNKYDNKYSPKAVSIGPIHHDNKNLKIGDNYKLTLAAKYIQSTQHTPQFLHKKIADNISKLKDLFADDVLALVSNSESLQGFRSDEEKLSWLLFVDGCFLLCILDFDNTQFVDDEDMSMKFTQLLVQMMTDVLLLENQLPYLVLKLLWKNDNEKELIDKMYYFLQEWDMAIRDDESRRMPGILEKLCTIFQKTKQEPAEDLPNEPQPPIHLLDLQRSTLVGKSKPKEADEIQEHRRTNHNRNTT